MKSYILIVSRNFPIKHPRKGQHTLFVESIESCTKIHTIRANFEYWNKAISEVQKGYAYISLRYWEGLPYKSKQVEFMKLCYTDNISIEKLTFEKKEIQQYFEPKRENQFTYISPIDLNILSKNDGLSLGDFESWFAKYDLSKDMAIIHFTDFRYFN